MLSACIIGACNRTSAPTGQPVTNLTVQKGFGPLEDAETAKQYPDVSRGYREAGFDWPPLRHSSNQGSVEDDKNADSYISSALTRMGRDYRYDPAPQGLRLSEFWEDSHSLARVMARPDWPAILSLLLEAGSQSQIDFHADIQPSNVGRLTANYPFMILLLRAQALKYAKAQNGKSAAACINAAWNLSSLIEKGPIVGYPQSGDDPIEFPVVAEKSFSNVCDEIEQCIAALCPRKGTDRAEYSPMSCPQLEAFRSALALSEDRPKMKQAEMFLTFDLETNRILNSQRSFLNPIDKRLSQAKNEKTRPLLRFWVEHKEVAGRLDTDFLHASDELRRDVEQLKAQKPADYEMVGKVAAPILGLAEWVKRNNLRRVADLALADCVVDWCKLGRWPASFSDLPASDRSQPVLGELRVTISPKDFQIRIAPGQNPDQAALPIIPQWNMNLLVPQVDSSPVLASFPPPPTDEDKMQAADQKAWDQRQERDSDSVAPSLSTDQEQYRAKGLPALDHFEGKDLSPKYLKTPISFDQRIAQQANDRFGKDKTSLDPDPWLKELKSLTSIKPVSARDPMSEILFQSVRDYSREHFCAINLAYLYGVKALKAAKQADGLQAANWLNQAWNLLKSLSGEPVEVSVAAIPPIVEEVCSKIEACAATLVSNPQQFEVFRGNLSCKDNPISVSRWMRAEIPLEVDATIDDPSTGILRNGVQSPLPVGILAGRDAAIARELEFWTKNASLLDRLDSPDQTPIRELNRQAIQMQPDRRLSFDHIKWVVRTLFLEGEADFAMAYYLRDGEKILLDAIDYKLHHNGWPQSIEQLNSKTATESANSWSVQLNPSVSSGSSEAGPQFEVFSYPGGGQSSGSAPAVQKRGQLALNGPVVVAYPPLGSNP